MSLPARLASLRSSFRKAFLQVSAVRITPDKLHQVRGHIAKNRPYLLPETLGELVGPLTGGV